MTLLTTLLALAAMLCAVAIVARVWKGNKFHPGTSFLLLAIVDVFFPAVYWLYNGQVNNPDWLPLLQTDQILVGLVLYTAFLFLFVGTLLAVAGVRKPRLDNSSPSPAMQGRLLWTISLLLFLTFLKIGLEVVEHGGFERWFWSKFVFSSIGSDGRAGADGGFLLALPFSYAFQAVVGLGFFYRKRLRHPTLFGVVFPVVALVLAMATFLRGSVLNCAITFVFAEMIRHSQEGVATRAGSARGKRFKHFFALMLAVFISIYLYGSVRDSFRAIASNDSETISADLAVPTFLTAGHGLLGVSHIVASYGESVPLLGGKTYIDMLLLPVPRVIYTSKPEWYGIDDITRGMGWPESTQSAVTMPGEAFANFGLLGLLVALPLGAAFGMVQRLIILNEVRFVLLAPTVFFAIPSVANWMSFTGIMNSFSLLVMLFLLAKFIRGGKKTKISRDPGLALLGL